MIRNFTPGHGGGGGGGGGAAVYTEVTSGPTVILSQAVNQEVGINKVSGSPTAVTLPSGPAPGDLARVSDVKGDAGTNPITVSAFGGGTINGASGGLVMDVNFETTLFRANAGGTWNIL